MWRITDEGKNREVVFQPDPDEKTGDERLLDTLHTAIADGTEPPTSGKNNLETLKLLLTITQDEE